MATYKLFSVYNTKKATLAATGIGAGISTAYLVGKSIKDRKSKRSNN